MNRSIVRTLFSLATLLLSLAAVAPAQIDRPCSLASVAGTWGHTFTGTLILPTAAVPTAAVGTTTIDAAGNFSGKQTSSLGGSVGDDALKGTITVNSDCTGTLMARVYDQSGNLLRTAVWALVFVDNAREVRAIFKSLVLANGTSVPTVITVNVRKLFPGGMGSGLRVDSDQ